MEKLKQEYESNLKHESNVKNKEISLYSTYKFTENSSQVTNVSHLREQMPRQSQNVTTPSIPPRRCQIC